MNDYDLLYKLILVGESGVGKSSLVSRYCDDLYNEHFTSTIGVDFKIKTINYKNKKIKLQIWDTAGQERYRSITKSYYSGSYGAMVIYDSNNYLSFNKVRYWIEQLKAHTNSKCQILLVETKCDVDKREVDEQEARDLANEFNCEFIQTSAKNSFNVDEAFIKIINACYDAYSKEELINGRKNNIIIDQDSIKLKKYSDRCCNII